MKHRTTWLAMFVLLASVPLASAQRVLLGQFGDFEFPYFTGAILDLGLQDVTTVTVRQDDFLDELRSLRFDLVIVRSIDLFQPDLEDAILTELEDHVASGGKLHFQMAELDRASDRYLDLLGLEAAVELELPLHDLRAPIPPHPSVAGAGFVGARSEGLSPDYGDTLMPKSNSFVTRTFDVSGPTAAVLSVNGRVLVNGSQWDNWAPSLGSSGTIATELAWLLSCPADLDGDSDLTVFDFFEFQNLFDAGDPRADVFYDGRLDVFDFLAFFNQFQDGC
ncbi:MAG: GC-type dockerin domain-anchored protein [Phycisphaerales bacterium]